MSLAVALIIGSILFIVTGLALIIIIDIKNEDKSHPFLYTILLVILYFVFIIGLTYLIFEKGEKILLSEKEYSIVRFNSNYELSSEYEDEEHLYKIEDYKAKDLKTGTSYVYIIDENDKYKKIDISSIKNTENIESQETIIEREYKYKFLFIYSKDFEYSVN